LEVSVVAFPVSVFMIDDPTIVCGHGGGAATVEDQVRVAIGVTALVTMSFARATRYCGNGLRACATLTGAHELLKSQSIFA
jgi:hypothetical protein